MTKLTALELEQLRQQGQHSIARLMLQVYRNFTAMAAERYATRGHTGLGLAHTFLMANLDTDGTRIVTLAERMGTTKQFAGRLVQELEGRGYVATVPDPTDRRATLVSGTDDGWQFFKDACDVKSDIEAEFGALLGTEQMASFEAMIQKLSHYNADTSGAMLDSSLEG